MDCSKSIPIFLILYLFTLNLHSKELYSGQLVDYVKSNRYIQHLILITTIFVLVAYCDLDSIVHTAIYSLIIYAWFILTTKLDLCWSMLINIILVIGFVYQTTVNKNEKNLLKMYKNNSSQIKSDEYIESQINLIQKNNLKHKKYFAYGIAFISIVGSAFYLDKKYKLYGDNFDLTKFIFNKGARYN